MRNDEFKIESVPRSSRVPYLREGFRLLMDALKVVWIRLKAKSFRKLIRLAFLRVWPLSIFGRVYYRFHFSRARYLRHNRQAVELLNESRKYMSESRTFLLRELRDEGVIVTHLNEFIPEVSVLELSKQADKLQRDPMTRVKIENRFNRDDGKWYVVRALPLGKDIELPAWISTVVLDRNLLALVNGYLGFFCRLNYVDIWHNFPVSDHEPSINSELWHRDHEDRHTIKVFLYLSDVDEGAGPHQYLRRTHPHGEHYSRFPHFPGRGYSPTASRADAIEAALPRDLKKVCTGAAGSLVISDTVGFHRGGRCSERPRTVIVATYASNLAIDSNTYRCADARQFEALDSAGKYAIRAETECHTC